MTKNTPKPAVDPFYRMGCELCNGRGCTYCDPNGYDRKAEAEYMQRLASTGERTIAGDYYSKSNLNGVLS